MVLLPFMAWGNLKLFLRQCKLAEANNPQVKHNLNPFAYSSNIEIRSDYIHIIITDNEGKGKKSLYFSEAHIEILVSCKCFDIKITVRKNRNILPKRPVCNNPNSNRSVKFLREQKRFMSYHLYHIMLENPKIFSFSANLGPLS